MGELLLLQARDELGAGRGGPGKGLSLPFPEHCTMGGLELAQLKGALCSCSTGLLPGCAHFSQDLAQAAPSPCLEPWGAQTRLKGCSAAPEQAHTSPASHSSSPSPLASVLPHPAPPQLWVTTGSAPALKNDPKH